MFIKTLKYDFLFSRDAFLSMAAAMVVFATILRPWVPTPQPGNDNINIIETVFVVVILVCGVLAIFQVMQFFHKNFFDDTGYLMLTLPQKRFPLLASKVIVSFVWLNFMMLAAVLAVSIISASRFSLIGIINAVNPRTVTGLLNITWILDVTLVAMLIIVTLFFVITLAHSSLWRRRVHGLVAVAAGILYVLLYFGVYVVIGQRGIRLVRASGPVSQYNALGQYIGSQYFYDSIYVYRRATGLNVGRIPIGDGPLFFDIYRWGVGFALCVLAFFATYYLLKRHISL